MSMFDRAAPGPIPRKVAAAGDGDGVHAVNRNSGLVGQACFKFADSAGASGQGFQQFFHRALEDWMPHVRRNLGQWFQNKAALMQSG